MGKKRIEVIKKIDDHKIRKVTYCKRKKGLLKKSMELSILCDLRVFLYIFDPSQQRVIHFASHPELDILDLFNHRNQREYYSNQDYEEIGGRLMNEQDDAISANEMASDSGRDFDEGSNAGGKKKAPFQTKQGRIKRDQEKKSSQLGNLISQRMTIPRNHNQRVILEDARSESDQSVNASDEQIKVIKRMSTNRIFITEKSDPNNFKIPKQPNLSQSQVLDASPKLEEGRLHKFFEEDFEKLKSMNATYECLLEQIMADDSSINYLMGQLKRRRQGLILKTGLNSYELNTQERSVIDQQTVHPKSVMEISDKSDFKPVVHSANFGVQNLQRKQLQNSSSIKDQLFNKMPSLHQQKLENSSASQSPQGFRLVRQAVDRKRSPPKQINGIDQVGEFSEQEVSQIVKEFLGLYEGQLNQNQKQIIQEFSTSIQRSQGSNKVQFADRESSAQQISKTVNMIKFIQEKQLKNAGSQAQIDKNDLSQLIDQIKFCQVHFQSLQDDAPLSNSKTTSIRFVDTKPAESQRKRENKYMHKLNEKPIVDAAQDTQMDKLKAALNLNASSQGMYQSSNQTRPLVRMSSDILLTKNIEEPQPIRCVLPSQSFKSSKLKQASPQAKAEGQPSNKMMPMPKQNNFSGQLSGLLLQNAQNQMNVRKLDSNMGASALIQPQFLPKNVAMAAPENDMRNQIRASGPIQFQNQIQIRNKEIAECEAQQQQASQTQTSNSKEAPNQQDKPADEEPKPVEQNQANEQQQSIKQIQNQKPNRKRMTTGELLFGKNNKMKQAGEDKQESGNVQKQQNAANQMDDATKHIVETGTIIRQDTHGIKMQQPTQLDSRLAQNVTLSQFNQQTHHQVTENGNQNYQIKSQKILKRKTSQQFLQQNQSKIRVININGRPTPVIIQSISSQISSEKNQIQSQLGQHILIQVPSGGHSQIFQQSSSKLKIDFNSSYNKALNDGQPNVAAQQQVPLFNQPLAANQINQQMVHTMNQPFAPNVANLNDPNANQHMPESSACATEYKQNLQKSGVEQIRGLSIHPDDKLGNDRQQAAMPQQVVLSQRIETSSLQKYYSNQQQSLQKQHFTTYQQQQQQLQKHSPANVQQRSSHGPQRATLPPMSSNSVMNKLSTAGGAGAEQLLNENNSEKCIELLLKGNSIYRKISLNNNNNGSGQEQQHNQMTSGQRQNISKLTAQQEYQQHSAYNQVSSMQIQQPMGASLGMTASHGQTSGYKQTQNDDMYLLNRIQSQVLQSGEVPPKLASQPEQQLMLRGQADCQNIQKGMPPLPYSTANGTQFYNPGGIQAPLDSQRGQNQPQIHQQNPNDSAHHDLSKLSAGAKQLRNFNDQRLMRMQQDMAASKGEQEVQQQSQTQQYFSDPRMNQRDSHSRNQSNENKQNWSSFYLPDFAENHKGVEISQQQLYQDQQNHNFNGSRSPLNANSRNTMEHKSLPGGRFYNDSNITLTDQQINITAQQVAPPKLKKYEIIEIGDSNFVPVANGKSPGAQMHALIENQENHLAAALDEVHPHSQNQYQFKDRNVFIQKDRNASPYADFQDQMKPPTKKMSDQQVHLMNFNNRLYQPNKQPQQLPISENAPQFQKFAFFKVKDNQNNLADRMDGVDYQMNQNNIAANNNQVNFINQQQQQWCGKSAITHDTMSDISKLNLTSLSVINKQANEQDCQSNIDGPIAAQTHHGDNTNQFKKLKMGQLSKFESKYDQNPQQTQLNSQSGLFNAKQQFNQGAFASQIHNIQQQPRERFMPPNTQRNDLKSRNISYGVVKQPQYLGSQRQSSLMDVQNFEETRLAQEQQLQHNGIDIDQNYLFAQQNNMDGIQDKQQIQQRNFESGNFAGHQKLSARSILAAKEHKNQQQSNNLTNINISQDLQQAQLDSQDNLAKTENHIHAPLITEHNENANDNNEDEATKSKVVNMLNELDTDNISDNASNYTMFLLNQTNPHSNTQDQTATNGPCKQRLIQRNQLNQKSAHLPQINGTGARQQQNVNEVTKLQDFADKERFRARNQKDMHFYDQAEQSNSTLNCKNVFMKNNLMSERHHREDDYPGDGGSQAHSASAHSDFQYRNIRRPVKHEVTGCFPKQVDYINSKQSQSQKSYHNYQQNGVAQPSAEAQQPQDKSNVNQPVPQRLESHISFFKNTANQDQAGADASGLQPIPQSSFNNQYQDQQNLDGSKEQPIQIRHQNYNSGANQIPKSKLSIQQNHHQSNEFFRQKMQETFNENGQDDAKQYQVLQSSQLAQQNDKNMQYQVQDQMLVYMPNEGQVIHEAQYQQQAIADNDPAINNQRQEMQRNQPQAQGMGSFQQEGAKSKKKYKDMSFLPEILRIEVSDQEREQQMQAQNTQSYNQYYSQFHDLSKLKSSREDQNMNEMRMQNQAYAQSVKNGEFGGVNMEVDRSRSQGKYNQHSILGSNLKGAMPHSQHASKKYRDDSDSESIDAADNPSKSMSHNKSMSHQH